jgi:capsular polysaccharide biosynthesis protein
VSLGRILARAAARAANTLGVRGLHGRLWIPSLEDGRLRSVDLLEPSGETIRYLSKAPASVRPSPSIDRIYHERPLPLPATAAATLRDARVVGADGALVDPATGRIYFESVCSRASQLDKLRDLARVRLLPPVWREHGPLVVLASIGDDNYFQFVTDVLTRLHSFADRGTDGLDFLLDAAGPGWRSEFAELLGLSLVTAPIGNLRVDELVFPPCPTFKEDGTDVTLFVPAAVRWLGAALRDAAGARPGRPRRLYLTRRGTGWRRLTNEAGLEETLVARGYEVVAPEELSVAEQIRLFADAEVVVAPHGSALTNILFARSCTVVELVNPAYPSGVFYTLADALGHDYWYVVGTAGGDPSTLDFTCEPSDIVETLTAI